MTFINLEITDFLKKGIFYDKIYSGLSAYGYYSATLIINSLDNTQYEVSFTYINDPSITMFDLANKFERNAEHLYYFIRYIIHESDNNILDMELIFTKEEQE